MSKSKEFWMKEEYENICVPDLSVIQEGEMHDDPTFQEFLDSHELTPEEFERFAGECEKDDNLYHEEY